MEPNRQRRYVLSIGSPVRLQKHSIDIKAYLNTKLFQIIW